MTLIGPNCPGALSPGKANVGIIPAEIFTQGNIGLISRSGTLTYQIGHELTQMGLGNSTIVGIGGDPVVGSSFIDMLAKFQADPETEYVVMVGEIGGDEEEKAAAFIEAELTKPVVAYIAGFTAPPGKTMGHAGAIISGSSGTAEAKKAALEAKGIRVGTTPTETAEHRRRGRARLARCPDPISREPVFSGPPPLSVAERVSRGKAARRAAPRSSHAAFEPAADRPDPVDLLESQAGTRVPELVPIRYGRMLASPFTFYRGAALIMASDLAVTPRSGFEVQCCGDAHLSNFGLYASPERRLVFDINDFDETLPGPWEWDVKRLAVSVLIAGARQRVRRRRAEPDRARHGARVPGADGGVRRRCETSRSGTRSSRSRPLLPDLRARGRQGDAEARSTARRQGASARQHAGVRQARRQGRRRATDHLAPAADPAARGLRRIVQRDALRPRSVLMHSTALTLQHDRRHLPSSTGSSTPAARSWASAASGPPPGSRCSRPDGDPLVLQIKEAQPSVLEEFLAPSEYANAGERVVAGQRIMQASSDIFLGWFSVDESIVGIERDYYVRQLRDWKGSVRSRR